jgi:hypothetical protein
MKENFTKKGAGSEIKKKFIPNPDPGSRGKKAPDPGSATLICNKHNYCPDA